MVRKSKDNNDKTKAKSINLDIDKIIADAGKIPDSKLSDKQSGIVSLDEGAGISSEFFTRDKKKD